MQDDAEATNGTSVDAHVESLSEQFGRLCEEADRLAELNPPDGRPALPGLTEDEAKFLARNDAGEVYMTSAAVAEANSELRPAVLSAFKKALAHAFGDDSADSVNWDGPMEQKAKDEVGEAEDDCPTSFAELGGFSRLEPMPQLDQFDWAQSKSKAALDNFVAMYDKKRSERVLKAETEAQEAMIRATAAGTRSSQSPHPPKAVKVSQTQPFNDDPVVWAAQEEAAASAVLRDLRAGFSRMRKGSSRAPPEGSPVWTLLSQKNSKLKPEAAAEMARAKIAAAAAAAAMREDEPEHHPEDSLGDLKIGTSAARESFSALQLENDSNSDSLDFTMMPRSFDGPTELDLLQAKNPGIPRTLKFDANTRLKNVGKKKRVGFAEGTVFRKKG